MKPIDFKEKNKETLFEKENIPYWTDDDGTYVTCWKCGLLDRLKILFTGKIWLGVYSDREIPASWIDPNKPFDKETEK